MNEVLLADMQHLFMSENATAQKAAALCCHYSKNEEADWEDHKGIDQTELFNDNSVLRGQKPKVDADKIV